MTPELIVWWAMRQWLEAKGVADQVNAITPGMLSFWCFERVADEA